MELDLDAPVFTGQVHLKMSYRTLARNFTIWRKDWLIQDLIREGKMITDNIEPFNERFKEARAKVEVVYNAMVRVGDVDLYCTYVEFAHWSEHQKDAWIDQLVEEGALKLPDMEKFNARYYEARSKLAGWWYWWIYDALSCSSLSTKKLPRRARRPNTQWSQSGRYWNDISAPPTPTHSPPATRPSSPTTTIIAEREAGCIIENVTNSIAGTPLVTQDGTTTAAANGAN